MARSKKAEMPKNAPPCNYHDDCVSRCDGLCVILRSNDFKHRDCPFYKNAAQIEADNALILSRTTKAHK